MYNYKVHIALGDSLRILCNMSVHTYRDARAAGRRTVVPRSMPLQWRRYKVRGIIL